jgi:multiple antibiotic resistance protein
VKTDLTLFISTFTTLLAIINPLEALPIFLQLMAGKDEATHRDIARRSCIYAALLMFFFLIFGNLTLRIFEVPLSMVRMVGGIILVRIGFSLFMPSASNQLPGTGEGDEGDVAFVPLAMPLMFGPGAIATLIGMSATIKQTRSILSFVGISIAIALTMFVTYLALRYANGLLRRLGEKGIDAATRIVGFFVSAMGMGLIFHGLTEVLSTYGISPK